MATGAADGTGADIVQLLAEVGASVLLTGLGNVRGEVVAASNRASGGNVKYIGQELVSQP